MRKINLCYFLFVGVLVSCTNTYDVCEMQRNETEDMSSRMAGDGVYDVLGFGYDITEDYLGENSTRLQVIDVKALIRDNGDRFYNPFIGTIDQKIVAEEINFGVNPTKYNTCIKSYLSNNNTSYTMNYSVKVNYNNT